MATNNGHLYNEAAEQSVLAAILAGTLSMEDCLASLSRESFHLNAHRQLFDACHKVYERGSVPDLALVSQHYSDPSYVSKLAEMAFYNLSVTDHITALRDLHIRRSLQGQAQSIYKNAANYDQDVQTIVDNAQTSIIGLTQNGKGNNALSLAQILDPVFDQIESGGSDMAQGIPTGLSGLDNILSGLNPTDLTIIAARPGMGKSTLAGQLEVLLGIQGEPCCFFSLEMDRIQLVYRMLAYMAKVRFENIRNSTLDDQELAHLYNAAETLQNLPCYIDDTPGLKIYELKSRVRKQVQKNGARAIIIDYLTKIKPSKKVESRDQEVGHIAAELKDLAKELRIPIVCLAQLNRECDKRKNPRPILSDLRDSGNVEQEADNIIFLYRDAAYTGKSDRTAEIIVAKQRNGPRGTVKMAWMGEYQSFEEMAYYE